MQATVSEPIGGIPGNFAMIGVYEKGTGDVKFSPIIMGSAQMKGMHGIDEHLETNCLPGAVDYYKNIIKIQEEF